MFKRKVMNIYKYIKLNHRIYISILKYKARKVRFKILNLQFKTKYSLPFSINLHIQIKELKCYQV